MIHSHPFDAGIVMHASSKTVILSEAEDLQFAAAPQSCALTSNP
jgi:hypothetical protein